MKNQNNLNKIRIKLGITQSELADEINMSKQQVSYIENYKCSPSVHTALKIAKCLKVNVHELFYL